VGYFEVAGFATADLSITKVDGADPVIAGTSLSYTVTVTNAGPDPAASVSWTDTLPAGTTFLTLSSPGGWSCTTPAVGAGGTVSCSIATLGVGSAVFTLTVAVDAGVAAGTVLSNTATATSTTGDPDTNDLSATATTTVGTSADLSITKSDGVDPILAGSTQTYTITVTNAGPSDASSVVWTDTLPAGTRFLSLAAGGGWSCTTPPVGSAGTVSCSISSLAALAFAPFTLQVTFDAGLADGTVVTNTANVTSATPDPQGGDNSGSAATTVNRTGNFFALTPCRVVDTRPSSPLVDGVPRTIAFHGVCGIPATATSVVLNVTAVNPSARGDLRMHASDETPPSVVALPFDTGRTRALMVVSKLSNDAAGEVLFRPLVLNGGTVHLVVDVTGYFE
jgi:uncharacterized repeat protein (TIGR01451 family)